MRCLEQLAPGSSLAAAFVDVDKLKAVNDSRGHAAGDRLLIEVVEALRSNLRPYDLVIRCGGDEFVCVMSGLAAATAAERLGLVNGMLAAGPEHGSITVGVTQRRPSRLGLGPARSCGQGAVPPAQGPGRALATTRRGG